MRWILTIAALVIAELGYAQPYAGDFLAVNSEGALWRVTRGGQVTTLSTVATWSDGLTIDYDNRGIYWTDFGSRTNSRAGAIYEWRNGVNTVVFSAPGVYVEEVLVNQNGELIFTGHDETRTPPVVGVFKWSGGAQYSTIATAMQMDPSVRFLDNGAEVNVLTGNYVVGSRSTCFEVSPDGTVTSVASSLPSAPAIYYSVAQDKRDGTFYCGGTFAKYVEIKNGVQSVRTPAPGAPLTPFGWLVALCVDRASVSDANRKLWAVDLPSINFGYSGITEISDPSGPAPTYLGMHFGVFPDTQPPTGMVFEGSKNIGSLKTGPGAYTLHFSFPGEGGAAYSSAVGLSGTVPGFVTNGLNVCLNVDALVLLSAQGLLAPYYIGGPGNLDANGNATGSIALGADNLGVLAHIVCVTVANGALRTVSSPYVMKL